MRVPGSPEGRSDIFVNGALQPFRGPSGDVEGVMVFAFDVSKQVIARKRTEALGAVTSALAQEITTADVAEVVATKGCQTVEADACAVFLADDALEGGRTDELLRRGRHQDAYGVPLLGGEARQLQRLIGGDSAAHPEQDAGHHALPASWLSLVLVLELARGDVLLHLDRAAIAGHCLGCSY
jgi:hypothetical protein